MLDGAMPRIGQAAVAVKAAADITRLLPSTEWVDTGTATVQVDDSVLRTYTLRLEVAVDAATRRRTATQIRQYLTSLASANGAPGDVLRSDPAALKALLAEGTSPAQKSLADYLSEWVAKFTDAITKWLVANLGARGASVTLNVALWVVILALAALVAFLLVRAMARVRRSVAARDAAALALTSPVVAAAEGLPDDILGHADSLAGEGRFRDAVRALFGGAARELVDRGLLRRTRTRTDAELLADVAPAAPAVTPPLRALTDDFEVAWYGQVDPRETGFNAARARYGEVLEVIAEAAVSASDAAARAADAAAPEAGEPR
jgi:hypothetical protein